jgi:hypothetical protein
VTFINRIGAALKFEDEVVERLNTTGWRAFHFGQSQLPKECRDLLFRFEDSSRRPCLIRWMPDIITFRTYSNGRTHVALLDAKVCGDRPNYAVEMSAVETAEAFTNVLFTPTFFVFDDWHVMTPRDVRQRGLPGPPPKPGANGSGTPYVLVQKRWSRPFNEIFPPTPAAGAA